MTLVDARGRGHVQRASAASRLALAAGPRRALRARWAKAVALAFWEADSFFSSFSRRLHLPAVAASWFRASASLFREPANCTPLRSF